ncbi:peroxidase-like [Planococcus citri]|uniref:peroxidase-like n=1 Tax=Planococcus citri TaxID=170843 RepID=UPI0031F88950
MYFVTLFILIISIQLGSGQNTCPSDSLSSFHSQPESCAFCASVEKGKPIVIGAQSTEKQNIGDQCFSQPIECNPEYKYRYPDGRCNNLKHLSWGMTNHTIVRLQPAAYSTNPNDPPGSQRVSASDNVSPLTSPRVISNRFFPDIRSSSPKFTMAFMTLSQFMTHDVLSRKLREPPPDGCCKNGTMKVPPNQWNSGCLSMDIPEDDPYYNQHEQICYQLPRAQFSTDMGCKLCKIEQLNNVNSYVDASALYGNSDEISKKLRSEFKDGKLKFETIPDGRVFLPCLDKPNPLCFLDSNKAGCFKSTDFGVNQNIQFMALHVVLLRVHNKLCDELKKINAQIPEWQTDEKLYQEAKRILSAILQHIMFGRISEIIFGKECAKIYGFSEPNGENYFSGYDQEINVQTTAEFQHVAFKTFHGLVEGNLLLYNDDREIVGQINFSDWYNNPTFLKQPGNLDKILIGLITQPLRNFNRFYTKALTNEFFKQLNHNKYGADLAAIDILRSRDCGIQPYIYFSILAGYPIAKDFQDLSDRIEPKLIEQLRKTYKSVADIDAIVGVMLEAPFGDSLVGKTLHYVIAEQFRRYKFGDSFFYSFEGRGQFTPGQLETIRSSSLAFLICYGSDNIQHVQKDAFTLSGDGPLEDCSKIVDDFIKQIRMNWMEKSN